MLKIGLKTLLSIVLTLLIFVLNLYFSYLLPYPWKTINLVILFLLLILGLRGSGNVVWLAFFSGVLMDLYSELYFGVFSISLTFSTLIIYWLYYDIFTNKSIWSIAIMTLLEIIIFRIFYTILIVFNGSKVKLTLFSYYGWEILFTTILTFILYFLLEKILFKLKVLR